MIDETFPKIDEVEDFGIIHISFIFPIYKNSRYFFGNTEFF